MNEEVVFPEPVESESTASEPEGPPPIPDPFGEVEEEFTGEETQTKVDEGIYTAPSVEGVYTAPEPASAGEATATRKDKTLIIVLVVVAVLLLLFFCCCCGGLTVLLFSSGEFEGMSLLSLLL